MIGIACTAMGAPADGPGRAPPTVAATNAVRTTCALHDEHVTHRIAPFSEAIDAVMDPAPEVVLTND